MDCKASKEEINILLFTANLLSGFVSIEWNETLDGAPKLFK